MWITIAALALVAADGSNEITQYLYPTQTRLIAEIDLEAIKRSGLFDEDLERAFQRFGNSNDQVSRISKLLKFDPAKDLTGFTVCGGAGSGRRQSSLVVIKGRFPYEATQGTLEKLAQEGELTRLEYDDLPVFFNHRSRRAGYFALIDGRTMIASASKSLIENSIHGLTELRQPSEELAQRLSWKQSDDVVPAVRLAGFFPEEARQQMANAPPLRGIAQNLVGYNIVARLGDTSRLEGRLTMSDAAAVDRAVVTFRGLIELGKRSLENSARTDIRELLEKLELSADGTDLLFTAVLPRELLQRVIDSTRDERDRARKRARKRALERDQQDP